MGGHEGFARYLLDQIRIHIQLFFEKAALDAFDHTPVRFLPYNEAVSFQSPGIYIPSDLPYLVDSPCKIDFNETKVCLWNSTPIPCGSDWLCLPNSDAPLWYINKNGGIIPAWNLYGILKNLLTFADEKNTTSTDPHHRFLSNLSSRASIDTIEAPTYNEIVALLVDCCISINRVELPGLKLNGLVKRPNIIISHDVDLLFGNDILTQSIRVYRMLSTLNVRHLWWIIKNYLSPKEYYFNDILRMISLEKEYGFVSTFYFLNGKGGRFGARNGSKGIAEANKLIPDEWPIGIHYNYDTYLNKTSFSKQKLELENIIGQNINCGRAHYLRFESVLEFMKFLWEMGITIDESIGYPDRIGYRCGLAGIFRPYDEEKQCPMPIWEVPLSIMDATLINQYPTDMLETYERMICHLSKVGGAMSILVHPGELFNPENPKGYGLYPKILDITKKYEYVGASIYDLEDSINSFWSLT